MKQAIVDQTFHDKEADTLRVFGGVFLVDDERGEYLRSLGLVTLRDVEEPAPKKATRTRKK